MIRIFKSIVALSLVGVFLFSPIRVSAAVPEIIKIEEFEVTQEALKDGVTVLITRNSDGTFEQSISENEGLVPSTRSTADGVLEWAEFHLGFKDWTNYAGDLYYTVKADEPMLKISGTAYVKPTNALLSAYYNEKFSANLYSSYNTSRTVAYDIDTGDATRVKVGFNYVILWTTTGDEGAFPNASKYVDR